MSQNFGGLVSSSPGRGDAHIVNCGADELKVGMKVKPYWHPIGDGTHLLMFQPDKDAA